MDQFSISFQLSLITEQSGSPCCAAKMKSACCEALLSNLKSSPQRYKVLFNQLTNNKVDPKAAPLHWMGPNPFSLGLSISSCRVPNPLLWCHYCTIKYQIPPVYYRYRCVSAVIDVSTTSANERLLIDRGEADKDHPDFTCFCRCF